jgi:hypothetical protein
MSNRRELFITLLGRAAEVIEWRLHLLRRMSPQLALGCRTVMSAFTESIGG